MNNDHVQQIEKIGREITECRMENARLRSRFETIIEAMPNGIIMVNKEGIISLYNKETIRLFGYSKEELDGMQIDCLVPDRFRGHHAEYRSGFLKSPKIRAMGAGRNLFGKRRDGSEFPIEIGLNPLETDQGTFVLAAIVDITERKAAEERFRSVVESTPNALVIVNSNGYINFVNSQTEQLFGYDRSYMMGKTIEMLVPERFRQQHPHFRNSFFEDPTSRPMGAGRDLFGLHADGREIPLEIGLKPIEIDGLRMVLAAIVDISERKLVDAQLRQANTELQQKNHEMEQFIYTVSHDLKSPIVTSMSYLQFIREDLEAGKLEEIPDALNRLERANKRMTQLINDLLLLSRIGRLELNPEVVDIHDLVTEVIQDLAQRHDNKTVSISIDPNIHKLFVDRFRLTQLFENLLGNAFKYGSGVADFQVSVGSVQSDSEVSYFVKDNGPGISPEFHKKIFGLFERLVTDKEGTGVGLAIVSRVAQLHSGRAWVESSAGHGATFWTAFPLSMLR